jgi:class 3 adenylate cyclase
MDYQRLTISGQAIVVAFDMCSSSNIIEDLTKSKNVQPLTTFFGELKRYLAKEQKATVPFDPYKFTGDGWLLLFPANTDGVRLLRFLENLCLYFVVEFRRSLLPHLSHKPALVGINFGIDKGELIPLTMYGQQEYVGRAINVACRLQAAVADKGRSPVYTALVSNRVYSEYFAETKPHRVVKVTRNLRNINGGAEFACRRLWLLRPYVTTDEPS